MLNASSTLAKNSGAEAGEQQGENRPSAEEKPQVVRALPITEKQLKVLKNRATEVLNRLEEVLDLDFTSEIEGRYISSFKAARGDIRQFLKCAVVDKTGASRTRVRQPNDRQPRNRMSRRAAIERKPATWVDLAAESRRYRQEKNNNIKGPWPRPGANGYSNDRLEARPFSDGWSGDMAKARPSAGSWPRDGPGARLTSFDRRSRERADLFRPQNQGPWAPDYQEPYSRQAPRNSFSRNGRGGSHFLNRNDDFPNAGSRNGGMRARLYVPASQAQDSGAPRSNFLGTNTSNRKRTRPTSSTTREHLPCDLCNVVMGSQVSYEQHINGKRHRAKLNARELGSVQDSAPNMGRANMW